jgi:2-methylisocitrate lyase-like PEP mutase family enzyme
MNSSMIERFRELHLSGCFVMPNPWDVGSAIYLQQLGFKALATSSAGFGFTRGLPDAVWAIPRDAVLGHVRELAGATQVPLNADFQSGYAQDLEGLAESVELCVQAGAAGLSIEDARDEKSLYDFESAVARLRAARTAIDKTKSGVLLTARCEAFLVGHPEPAKTAIDRLVAFADAGADCLYAPGVRDLETISQLVKAVAPKPVNVLVSSPGISLQQLAELGVRRVSVGSALARAAWSGFMHAAKLLAEGSFEGLATTATFAELNAIFAR